MCGISGILSDRQLTGDTIGPMTSVLAHRGPDGNGIWTSPDGKVSLGHQRLSIVDLSPAGAQPMHSSNNRYCISYNGEVYNAREIRDELTQLGTVFRGHSDTEVLLEACALYGVEKAVKMLVGMFAFALWDKAENVLYLVRDRLGIKPLYWGSFGGLFLFASELKSLRKHPGWSVEINRSALAAYMRHGYVPAPHSIYNGIYKLAPGSVLKIKPGQEPEISRYWTMEDTVAYGLRDRALCSEEEAVLATENRLEEAVRSRMIADVPLGAFLSGGIDSSTVVALMQKNSTRSIKTFSIGFHEQGYDEAVYAQGVAGHLGTEHTEFYVSPRDALDVIPLLPDIYDEPFADSSQIPTYLVSKLSRQHVTVALTGDGGDEIFAGYNRYYLVEYLLKKFTLLTPVGRRILKSFICAFPPAYWTWIVDKLPDNLSIPQAGDKLYKLANILSVDKSLVYRNLISIWQDPGELVPGAQEPDSIISKTGVLSGFGSYLEQMQYLDTITYLPDDILTKVDRASMAVSLEARVPLLDHRLVEHAWSLPRSMMIRKNNTKWILRRILYKYVPEKLIERPKMGFAIPIDAWLRGPIRHWAESLLDRDKLVSQGYLNVELIHKKWNKHQSGESNWQYQLWNILMFQAWHERWINT